MTMPILRLGLILGTLGFGYVTWASTDAGFPIEIAVVRGMLAFMGLSFVAYVGELVVATAPSAAAGGSADGAADETDAATAEADAERDRDDDEPGDGLNDTNDEMTDAERLAALIQIPSRTSDDDELQAA